MLSQTMPSITFFILIFSLFNLVFSSGEVPINVTKHFSFKDFTFTKNSRLVYDVKLLGSARFSDEKGSLQIPNESQETGIRHQAGRGLYSFPIRLLDPITKTPASFQTTFSFQLNNSTSSDSDLTDNGGGSGLTFIIVPDEFTVGRPGPWLAMLNDACESDYKAVAVEFDTRMNPEFGDPNDNHVGINLGSIVSTKIINVSDVGVSLKDGSVHHAWIDYDGPRKRMDVRLGLPNDEVYPSKPIFSEIMDLSPYLNEYMFVGFSASTGNHTQIHNILSWNFTSTSQAFLRWPSSETCQGKILLQNTTETAETAEATEKSNRNKTPRSFLIFVASVVLALAVLVGFYFISKHRKSGSKSKTSIEDEIHRPRPPNKPRRFSFSAISSATRSFSEIEILGSDIRGVYYRGRLGTNGSQVAVKRFSAQFLSTHGSDKKRLLKEIKVISHVRHPNLLPIRGWCQDNNEIIAVYDFVPNGSLDKWLFGAGVLPWTRRFKVVKDVADGLSFLHTKQLAHKNMKCSSVFLDVSFRAVLGDFGFILMGAESKQFESIVCNSADVFEFGVIVLEVIGGRPRVEEVEEGSSEERNLLDFAWNLHETNEKVKLVDRRMGSLINLEQAIRVMEIGLLCTLNENKGRPSMEENPSPSLHQSNQRKKNIGNNINRHNPKNDDYGTMTNFKYVVKKISGLFTLILSGKSKTSSEAVEYDSKRNNKVRGVSSSTTDVSSESSKSSSKWKSSHPSTPTSTSSSKIGIGNFSFEELYKATGKFSPDNKIGEGAFGIVYKGRLYDGTLVAVKCARKDVQKKHLAEFKNEINTLSKIEHLNLVRWHGYLEHGDEKIIVIEYVNNGTLREHLDGVRGNGLEIGERLDVAIDVAHAVTYLHMYTDHPIIHRDIKASNILITDSLRAKVADFGFARLASEDPNATHISTQVKGTAGYLDPDYMRTRQLSEKSDVYSFGVLLVEMMTGRYPVEPKKPLNERVTIKWAMQLLKQGEEVIAMDPRLRRSSASNRAVQKVLKLAFQCLAPVRRSRPSMQNCAEVLWDIRKEFRDKAFSRPPLASHHSADFPQKDSRKNRRKTFGIEDDKKYKFVSA